MKSYVQAEKELAEAGRTPKDEIAKIEKILSGFLKANIKLRASAVSGVSGDIPQNKLGSLSNLFSLVTVNISQFLPKNLKVPEESATIDLLITDKFGNRNRLDLSQKLIKSVDGSFEIF